MTDYVTKSENETIRLADEIAGRLAPSAVVTLTGPLGAGKSVFARAIVRVLTANEEEDVPSPTFTLVQNYDTPEGPVRHFDLYRLERAEDVLQLDWDEAMFDGIALIEWPDKAGKFLPEDRIDIDLEIISDTERRITITPQGEAALNDG